LEGPKWCSLFGGGGGGGGKTAGREFSRAWPKAAGGLLLATGSEVGACGVPAAIPVFEQAEGERPRLFGIENPGDVANVRPPFRLPWQEQRPACHCPARRHPDRLKYCHGAGWSTLAHRYGVSTGFPGAAEGRTLQTLLQLVSAEDSKRGQGRGRFSIRRMVERTVLEPRIEPGAAVLCHWLAAVGAMTSVPLGLSGPTGVLAGRAPSSRCLYP